MKLYAFQPTGHGQKSFFVMAESEQEAKYAIGTYLIDAFFKDKLSKYDFEGWDTDYYTLTVLELWQVIMNGND